MDKTITSFCVILAIVAMMTSCSKFVADEEQDEKLQPANSVLTVNAVLDTGEGETTPGEEDAVISYPVNIYVFNDKGKCVDVSSINDKSAGISFKLAEGQYDVYAVAGATADNYDLPTKETATADALINLLEGKSHGDLMTAHNSITMQANEENKLSLALERKVIMIQSVVLNNIPDNVSEVSVTISPVYTGLLLNGEYSESTGSQTINLSRVDETSKWKNTEIAYSLPTKGKPTIKVSMKKSSSDALISYSYSSGEEFPANYKVDITGNFKGGSFSLSGTLTGAKWAGNKTVTFEFGEGEGETEEEKPVPVEIPEEGTVYKNCYVVSVDKTKYPVEVTLMALEHYTEWTFKSGDIEAMTAELYAKLNEKKVEGITSTWRIPTASELFKVCTVQSDFNKVIKALKKTDNSLTADEFYSYGATFFVYESDAIKAFQYSNSGEYSILDSPPGTKTILRPFTTIQIK